MESLAKKLILGLVISFLSFATALAQDECPDMVDDGFAGGTCCATTTPDIPTAAQIPVIESSGQYGVFQDCALLSNYNVAIILRALADPGPPGMGPPFTFGIRACDELLFRVEVISGPINFTIGQNPATTIRGSYILGKFTRTWTFVDSDEVVWQTWRYLSSGDAISFSSNLTPSSPDPIPSCYSTTAPQPTDTFPAVAFWGTIDISCGTVNNVATWRFSLSLSHYDGCLSHLPSPLNDRSITSSATEKHVGYSYHLVNPGNFNWLSGAPVSSSLLAVNSSLDAVRSTVTHTTNSSLPGPQCLHESATDSQTTEHDPTCGCDPQDSGNFYQQDWDSQTVYCNGNKNWSNVEWVSEIPRGFEQIYLGRWSSAARDDVKDVWNFLIVGTLDYPDVCDTWRNPGNEYKHIVYGTNYIYDVEDSFLPVLFHSSGAFATDMLLDFGDSCNSGDTPFQPLLDGPKFGTPEYTNVLWMISR